MKRLSLLATALLLLLLTAAVVRGAATERISATVVATNITLSGDTFTVNSDARLWTNATSSTTILTNQVDAAGVATNLFLALAAHPFGAPTLEQTWLTASSFRLRAPFGQPLVISSTTNWATITLSTQTIAVATYDMVWPWSGLLTTTIRTNQANAMVDGFDYVYANYIDTNAVAFSNYWDIGSEPHVIDKGKIISGTGTGGMILSNFTAHIVAGTISNLIAHSMTITNLLAPGTGPDTLVLGGSAGATAITNFAMAIGDGASSAGVDGIAIGRAAAVSITRGASIVIGADSTSEGSNSVAIGRAINTAAPQQVVIGDGAAGGTDAANAMAIGRLSVVGISHSNSVAFGPWATTTKTHQIMLGTATNTVEIPGRLVTATATNTTLTGNSTNTASWTDTVTTINTLADGANSISVVDNVTFIRFTGNIAQDSTLNGITNGWPGRKLILENQSSYTLTLSHEAGTEPSAINRIRTGSLADEPLANEGTAILVYDGTANRWVVRGLYPETEAPKIFATMIHSNVTESLTVGTTPVAITNYTQIVNSNAVTGSVASGGLTADTSGQYYIAHHWGFQGAAGGVVFVTEANIDGAPSGLRMQRETSSTDTGSSSLSGVLTLTAGEEVTIEASRTSGSAAITIVESNFTMFKL